MSGGFVHWQMLFKEQCGWCKRKATRRQKACQARSQLQTTMTARMETAGEMSKRGRKTYAFISGEGRRMERLPTMRAGTIASFGAGRHAQCAVKELRQVEARNLREACWIFHNVFTGLSGALRKRRRQLRFCCWCGSVYVKISVLTSQAFVCVLVNTAMCCDKGATGHRCDWLSPEAAATIGTSGPPWCGGGGRQVMPHGWHKKLNGSTKNPNIKK